MSADGSALQDLSRALAVVVHAGQCRKGSGEPYFNHVNRVANSCRGWRQKTIAYLHDVIEDTPLSDNDLIHIGFPDDIVYAVLALTRTSRETYREFIARAAQHTDPDVRAVKLADIRDNLRDIEHVPGASATLRKRYVTAEATILEAMEGDPS